MSHKLAIPNEFDTKEQKEPVYRWSERSDVIKIVRMAKSNFARETKTIMDTDRSMN